MNFDKSLHQKNLVRNLILKCALPVVLLAIVFTYLLYWTNEAVACLYIVGATAVKIMVSFVNYVDPFILALNKTEFWIGVVTVLWLLKPFALPLLLILVGVMLTVGCTLNKLKLRGITDQRYEKLVKIWKVLTYITLPLSLMTMLVETNCSHNDLLTLFRVSIIITAALFINISLYRVEKVNGAMFVRKLSN